jgi:hypothetical protein
MCTRQQGNRDGIDDDPAHDRHPRRRNAARDRQRATRARVGRGVVEILGDLTREMQRGRHHHEERTLLHLVDGPRAIQERQRPKQRDGDVTRNSVSLESLAVRPHDRQDGERQHEEPLIDERCQRKRGDGAPDRKARRRRGRDRARRQRTPRMRDAVDLDVSEVVRRVRHRRERDRGQRHDADAAREAPRTPPRSRAHSGGREHGIAPADERQPLVSRGHACRSPRSG